jgi:hypothetical protein
MSKFEDHLWREVARQHGPDLDIAGRPRGQYPRPGRRVLASSTLGLAGLGTVLAFVLSTGATSPAFAVTRNHNGTVTVSIRRSTGIAGANAKLHQLGINARVLAQVPVGCSTSTPMAGHGAPAPSGGIANAHWTINPSQVPAGQTLALTPPPTGNSGNTAPSGNSGSSGQIWECPIWSQSKIAPSTEPAPGAGNGGNSGYSGITGITGNS